MSHIDLHLHLLPGVDDGPPDLASSVGFAAALAAAGVHDATVTPHVGHARFPLDVRTIPDRTAALQEALDRAAIPLRLRPGGEIHPSGATDLAPGESAVQAARLTAGNPGFLLRHGIIRSNGPAWRTADARAVAAARDAARALAGTA